MQKVILLHAFVATSRPPRWASSLLEALPYARRLQLERADDARRFASLGGLALALSGAARLAPPGARVTDLVLDAESKPRFATDAPAFSVSHSADRVGCALACGADLGLDLEDVPAPDDDRAVRELQRWTATEAALKAAGLGLRSVRDVILDEASSTATVGAMRYHLHALRVSPRTLGHLATTQDALLEIDEVDLDGAEVSAAVERALRLAPQRP